MNVHAGRRPPIAQSGAATSAGSPGRGVPVDRGWAWVILAAAFGIFGLQIGSFKIYGLIYVRMVEHFRSDPRVTMWVIAAAGPISLVAGPLISVMLKKTSHRFVTVVGSVLAAAGAAATGCIPKIEIGFLTFSIVYGLGMTCLGLSSLTCTVSYFERYRGLAVGLTSTGAGVMSFVLPVAMTALFETYTFDGAMLMYAGFLLQAAVLGCLLRPPSMYNERPKQALAQPVAWTVRATEPARADTDSSPGLDSRPKHTGDMERPGKAVGLQPVGEEKPIKGQCERHGRINCPAAASASSTRASCDLLDISLLRSERMWIVGLIGLFASNGMTIVFTAIPPHGDSVGLPRATTSMLIAIGGSLEIVFRVLQGWFSDRHVMPVLVQLGLCTGLTGIAAVLCPVIGGAAGIGLLAALCGAGGTSVYALTVVVLRELLGDERVTSAMGIQSLFLASSYVLSTFAMVYVTETYGSWHYVFYYIGGNLMVSSVLCIGYTLVLKIRGE